VLSATRLKFTLTIFVVTTLLALSAMIFLGVTRIFGWLTPSIQQDLSYKARRGALELSQTTQLGMVVGDAHMVSAAVGDYLHDQDVVGLRVLDARDKPLFRQGKFDRELTTLFARQAGRTHDLGPVYAAWMRSEIEGVAVGRVAVLVSKARLEAGMQLRREILFAASGGCLVALLACLIFVSLYIGPILRMTGEAFVRLERTTEAALQATRLKSQFLANMSHEIRTPMNGILGVVDLLSRTTLTSKQQRYTQTIESSARGLLTIINDVLDLSKLEAGKYDLRVDDLDVMQLAQEVAELLSPKAHAKLLELVVRRADDVPALVRGDVDRVRQVLLNYLGNAIKFTDQGSIELRVSVDAHSPGFVLLRFSVIDTGPGIRAEDQAQLFGVFSQVDGSSTRKHGGTGLGLAISKRLVSAMGGQVGVVSAPGAGSTFWFTVRAEVSTRVVPQPVLPREAAVLLVTKSPVQQVALSELMLRWGMACEMANSAEDASARVLSHPGMTAVVVDGVFDGSERANTDLFDLCAAEGLPVIRLLSTTQTVDERTGAGLQTVLCKPVRVSELYNGLVALLDGGVVSTRRSIREQPETSTLRPGQGLVLVVDDNEINRLVAVELLTELGYQTEVACNGLEAVAKAKRTRFDAILMDCQMPELDGFQATAQIRQLQGELAKVPIIALTAHAMADDRDKVLRGGMDDYASKPIRARVLERLLRRWIGASGAPATGLSEQPTLLASEAESGVVAPSLLPASGPELDPELPRSVRAIELFLKTVPELIDALKRAVKVEDPVAVKQLAHKLKGSCLSLGATNMAAVCHAVELAALDGKIDAKATERIPRHLAVVAPLLSELARRVASNDS
jgi:signal transduction histidine kinase/CheY-like chemotaxis protein